MNAIERPNAPQASTTPAATLIESVPARAKWKTPACGDPFNEVEDVILRRRSVRAFREKQVPEYLVKRLLECGRFAPSAGNNQSWKFVVLRDPALIQEMTEYTRKWARWLSRAMDPTYPGAFTTRPVAWFTRSLMTRFATSAMHPTGLAGLAQLGSGELGLWHGATTVILLLVDTRGTGDPYIDVGIAGQNMVLSAHSMGLGTCWVSFAMFLERSRRYRQMLGIHYPMRLASSIAIGFPIGQPDGFVARETHETAWIENGGTHRIVY
jgi:nitroreductase